MLRDYYDKNLAEVNYREVSNLALFLNIFKLKYLTFKYYKLPSSKYSGIITEIFRTSNSRSLVKYPVFSLAPRYLVYLEYFFFLDVQMGWQARDSGSQAKSAGLQ